MRKHIIAILLEVALVSLGTIVKEAMGFSTIEVAWVVLIVSLIAMAALYRQEITAFVKAREKLQPKQNFIGNAKPISAQFTISKATATLGLPPWSKPYLRLKAMWTYWRKGYYKKNNDMGITIKSNDP